MSDYRVRYRDGDFEVEVASSDKSYVDSKLKELIDKARQAPQKESKTTKSQKTSRKTTSASSASTSRDTGHGSRTPRADAELTHLVNHITDHEDFENIDSAVLDHRSQLRRVMMCMYYAQESFADDPYLMSSEVEFVTDQLGVKVLSGNVSKPINNNRRFFHTDGAVKSGQVVGYKLNRSGLSEFEKILGGESTAT